MSLTQTSTHTVISYSTPPAIPHKASSHPGDIIKSDFTVPLLQHRSGINYKLLYNTCTRHTEVERILVQSINILSDKHRVSLADGRLSGAR